APIFESIASWRRVVANRSPTADKRTMLREAKRDLLTALSVDKTVHPELFATSKQAIFDALYEIAEFELEIPTDEAQLILAEPIGAKGRAQQANAEEAGAQLGNNDAQTKPIAPGRSLTVFPLLAFKDIQLDLKRRNYLVKGLLPRTGIAVIWGP